MIFLPAGACSLALALLPWRPPLLRASMTVVHVVAVLVIAAVVPPRWEVWLAFLGPGAIVAAIRGIDACYVVRGS